jgi:fluoride ion exporter CrcB/FEX
MMKAFKCGKSAKEEIVVAVIFAVLILGVSWMFKGAEHKDMLVIGMLGAYFVFSSFVIRRKKGA